ncbi:hypothetical protein QYE76_058388 [Lolium multiflorum]|uniref:Retrotransposon gag domain-containing protein n=1 Tax=Lolium multiflorum TaxID=4521 RepID=A0AAD8T6H0_LOLMU|nr:hypothetical protein QYE76_058388 [Lolium multiflorum]
MARRHIPLSPAHCLVRRQWPVITGPFAPAGSWCAGNGPFRFAGGRPFPCSVTYEDLTEELKKKYDEVKAILEADLIGSFHENPLTWHRVERVLTGALDGVDCPPGEERTPEFDSCSQHRGSDQYNLERPFGMVPKRRAIGYSKPYPNEYELIPLPPKYRLPEFSKFSGSDGSSAIEHVSRYLAQLGTISASDELRVRFFAQSLTGSAFGWYASLPPDSIRTWKQLEAVPHAVSLRGFRGWHCRSSTTAQNVKKKDAANVSVFKRLGPLPPRNKHASPLVEDLEELEDDDDEEEDKYHRPRWCPDGLSRSQKCRVQRLRGLEEAERLYLHTLRKARIWPLKFSEHGRRRSATKERVAPREKKADDETSVAQTMGSSLTEFSAPGLDEAGWQAAATALSLRSHEKKLRDTEGLVLARLYQWAACQQDVGGHRSGSQHYAILHATSVRTL